jgi:hypothetical protein
VPEASAEGAPGSATRRLAALAFQSGGSSGGGGGGGSGGGGGGAPSPAAPRSSKSTAQQAHVAGVGMGAAQWKEKLDCRGAKRGALLADAAAPDYSRVMVGQWGESKTEGGRSATLLQAEWGGVCGGVLAHTANGAVRAAAVAAELPLAHSASPCFPRQCSMLVQCRRKSFF